MKKIIIATLSLIAVFFITATENSWAQDKSKSGIEILYFHGKQRCKTCNAIESLTKEVLETSFGNELKQGKIKMKIIDISKKENDKIAEKYEVTWSSLFVNKWNNGAESINNMTNYAFSCAKDSPDVFKEGLKKKIKELLK